MLVSYSTLAGASLRPGQKPHSCANRQSKQAVRERIIIAKALKVTAAAACSGAAPLLEFRQIAKVQHRAATHAFITRARPVTIT